MAFSLARLGARSSSSRSLLLLRSVLGRHAWRLRPLRFCLMSGSSRGVGLFQPRLSRPVLRFVAVSRRHAWRTRISSCAATWRLGDCITPLSPFLQPVALGAFFPSLLPIDVAGCFLFGRSCWSTGLFPIFSRAHLRVAYVAVLWRCHVALQPLSCHSPFLAPALLCRAFRVSGIVPSRLRARAFRSCPPPPASCWQPVRYLRITMLKNHDGNETSLVQLAPFIRPRDPQEWGMNRPDSAGGSRARSQVRFREAASR